ncbi:glycerol-3-phosphate dehydrogenase [Halorubrum californiense DSM 19288]|uniref:Glycerol-3-phosphate dehydrogenase n=1 Tax=Halorubrum californiense DSM 19288 TaxID=1227465 RepID=M0E6J8_9EURY|nr:MULTISPECIES: FAD-dependent oxidoreductase [Halorubrum]ELZ41969.1 glycerol-3-phosphate dehydrogenase [Halorubrum californiense DSM 19288]TKX66587.1 FAD-dependent oxidoreductase [Halorubrum sp. GN11GM_10-3_MGM]
MSDDPTVLVIGGGATGAGVARDLATRGVDATLVDRGGLGSGTSGRSHGLLHSGARYAEADAEGASECIEENKTLRDVAGACVRETGGLFVRLDGDDPDYFEEKIAACEAIGIETERLDGDAAREAVPGLADGVAEAFRVPDGVIYPSRLVAANAADAEQHGATVHPHAPVEDVTVRDGAVESVEVGGAVDATLEPEVVVNATGAWADSIAEMAGVEVGMAPSRGVMVSVEYDGAPPVLNRCRDPDDGDIVVPHDGEVVLGTTSVPVSDPDDYETEDWEVERSVEECAAMLPAVADAPTVRTWWGVRPLYAPDESGSNRRGISRGFTLLDHERDGAAGLYSVVGGKLTTYRQMAETTVNEICDRLGVDAACETATEPLAHADDPERLDELVEAYGGANPTDADVVGVRMSD